jgi:hypothetical protein
MSAFGAQVSNPFHISIDFDSYNVAVAVVCLMKIEGQDISQHPVVGTFLLGRFPKSAY